MNAITPNLSQPCKGTIQQQACRFKLPIAKQPEAVYNVVDGMSLGKGTPRLLCILMQYSIVPPFESPVKYFFPFYVKKLLNFVIFRNISREYEKTGQLCPAFSFYSILSSPAAAPSA